MVQYYTLEEAARILQTTPDEVRRMADEKKLRYFRDKGTLRFRAQEIDELARQLGIGSDADLQLGEVPPPRKGNSPAPSRPPTSTKRPSRMAPPEAPASPPPKKPSKLAPPDAGEVFDFSLTLDEEEAQVQLGSLPSPGSGGSKSGKSGKSSKKSKISPPSPPPKPGSDSDVRLVGDSGDDFLLTIEDTPQAPVSPAPGRKKPSQLAGPDSGARIVPLGPSDSDIKMIFEGAQGDDVVSLGGPQAKSASDSDIRLEHVSHRPESTTSGPVTEEIDLDAELANLAGPASPAPRPPSGSPQLPTSSPFELSEEDLDMGLAPAVTDSSGDFELTPEGDELSPLELGSDELPAVRMESEEEVSLGDLSEVGEGGSGINLRDPADSGISLEEEGSDSLEFELSLDAGSTPPPGQRQLDDSDSEFELSLDDSDESSETISAESSEFELSLDDSGSSELELDLEMDEAGSAVSDSDSEFELTLDDSGGSSPLEESVEEEGDIFETDFEVPALEEESGSEAVSLEEDTDLESSDFDLALDDLDVGAEDESGSQVIALDDEEDPDAGQPRKKQKTRLLMEEDEDEDIDEVLEEYDEEGNSEFAGIGPALEEEEEDEELAVVGQRGRVPERPAAPWGPIPVILMLPAVIVLFVIGLLGFEMIQGMTSYQKTGKFSGLLITPITEALTGEKLPGSPPKK